MALEDQIVIAQDAAVRRPDGWEAIISKAPVDVNDMVMVTIAGFDEDGLHEFGPCPWPRRGTDLPLPGDRCLVSFDDSGDPWVTSWWSGYFPEDQASQADLVAHAATELAARAAAVAAEAALRVAGDATEAAARAVHAALTTTAHGGIVSSADARLTDTRTPTNGSVTRAKLAPDLSIRTTRMTVDAPAGGSAHTVTFATLGDTLYTAVVSVNDSTSGSTSNAVRFHHYYDKQAAQLSVWLVNDAGATKSVGIHVLCIHD